MPIYSAPFLWGSHISAPFTVISGGEAHTVYMAAGRCTQSYPNTGDSRSAEEYSQWECGVGFYKHLGRAVILMNCSFFHTVNGAEHLRDALIEEN